MNEEKPGCVTISQTVYLGDDLAEVIHAENESGEVVWVEPCRLGDPDASLMGIYIKIAPARRLVRDHPDEWEPERISLSFPQARALVDKLEAYLAKEPFKGK